ncbi:hypothetical protein ZWY2020_054596, partial [Hordeum vulgare]
ATPLIAGLAVAATALAGRYGIQAWQAYKARPIVPRINKFYEGGFQATMTRRKENVRPDKVKEAHKRVMVANHPDAGEKPLPCVEDQRGKRCFAGEN